MLAWSGRAAGRMQYFIDRPDHLIVGGEDVLAPEGVVLVVGARFQVIELIEWVVAASRERVRRVQRIAKGAMNPGPRKVLSAGRSLTGPTSDLAAPSRGVQSR